MPSPVNTPLPIKVTAVTTAGAVEFLIATSSPTNLDGIETVVLIDFNADVTNSASGVTILYNIRADSLTGSVVQAWGPYDLTASKRSMWGGSAIHQPGLVMGKVYCLTATVASNAGTFTVNTAILSLQAEAAS